MIMNLGLGNSFNQKDDGGIILPSSEKECWIKYLT